MRSARPVLQVPKLGRELSLEVAVQKFEVVRLSAMRHQCFGVETSVFDPLK